MVRALAADDAAARLDAPAAPLVEAVAGSAALEMRFARFAPVPPRAGNTPPPGAAAVRA